MVIVELLDGLAVSAMSSTWTLSVGAFDAGAVAVNRRRSAGRVGVCRYVQTV